MFATAPTQDLAAFGGSRGGAHAFLDLVTRTGAGLTPSVTRAAHASRVRTLVDEHFNFVWRYLRGLGIPDAEADDAAQQVFMTVAAKIDAVQEGAERSFLVRTAHGVAANARRAVARRREVPGEHAVDDIADETPDAEERAQTGEALAILDRFLASLPDNLREVFILFELEGLTMAAIADNLGLPPGTVASRLRRGREEFQEMAKRLSAARARERR